ncbi:MAG: hypothetical protein LBH06_02090 [Rikenellaceae bacterium]|jgi:hypothetical protein|nr:hypothetical protein [Rikenellaceae bacterium]
MKKIIAVLGAALAAGLASCNMENGHRAEKMIELRFAASTPAPNTEGATRYDGPTRVALDGTVQSWTVGDRFRLFDNAAPGGGYTWWMTVDAASANTSSATFSGKITRAPGTMFYAVSPFFTDSVPSPEAVPITIAVDQLVDGPGDSGGVGKYMINIGRAAVPEWLAGTTTITTGDVIDMPFEPLTAVWDVNITNAGESVESVRIVGTNLDNAPFVSGGTVDITQDYSSPAGKPITVASPTKSSCISTTFANPSTADNITARIVMLPTEIVAADLRIEVTTGDGTRYVFNRTNVTRSMLRGVVYHSSVNLSSADVIEPPADPSGPPPTEQIIYATGFDDGFETSSDTRTNPAALTGPADNQWLTFFGAPSTNSAITLPNSMLIRWYSSTSGDIGYTQTDFALVNATKVVFKAKRTSSGFGVTVSYYEDGAWLPPTTVNGVDLAAQSTIALTSDPSTYTAILKGGAPVASTKIRFDLVRGSTNGGGIVIDDVEIYGMR